MKRVTNVDIHVGKKLKLRRVNLGLSQQELGSLLNISFQQLQKYEKGVNRISSGILYKLSKALTVPIQYFFDDLDDETQDSNKKFKDIDFNDLNKEILIISRLVNQIDDNDKKRILIDNVKNLIKLIK